MIDIPSLYNSIVNDNNLSSLTQNLTYYQADKLKVNILSSNLIEIDIASAFPTIIKILYGSDHEFVKNVFSIEDKLQRNILIATTLSNINTISELPYRISDLNIWSKMIIFGYVYSKYIDINILEYKKDSLLFSGELLINQQQEHKFFLDWLINNDITFHEKIIRTYARINKSSYYYTKNLSVKGMFKSMPVDLYKNIFDLFNGKFYDNLTLNRIKYNYSYKNLLILVKSNLVKDYQQIFMFGDNQYLTLSGKLETAKTASAILSKCSPAAYLRFIIFPILSLLRLHRL